MREVWENKKLGDFCDFKNGRAFKKTEWVEQGLPIIRIANLNRKNASFNYYSGDFDEKILIKKGDLLFSWSGTIGSSFGPHIWDSEDGLLNQHIYKVGYPKDIDSDFLYYLFLEITSELEKLTNGAVGLVHVKKSTLNDYDVKIPPLPQQKQIVAILDKAFAAIDTAKINAKQNLQNAKELFESYLQNVFENKGEDWENKPLSEVCDLIKRGSQPKYTESESGEIVLNQKCIRDHKINLSVARKHDTNKKTINKERYIQLGDGLINSTGTGTLGRVAQVRVLNFSAFVDTHITIVRPKKDVFYLDFFGWALIYIEKIIEKSGEGASGQTELSRKLVEKLVVSFPEKMKQQEQIVLKLDALSSECKKLEAIYTQKIADLDEMKKSVLQKAFSGQLNTIN